MAAMKRTVVIPAPTAASVKATSTAFISDQITAMINEYAESMIVAWRRSRTVIADRAEYHEEEEGSPFQIILASPFSTV